MTKAKGLPRFFDYKFNKQKGVITPKRKFAPEEKGLIGHFKEIWNAYGSGSYFPETMYDVLVFTPHSEFDAPYTSYEDYKKIPNHRFHKFLMQNIPLLRKGPEVEKMIFDFHSFEPGWHHFCGGETASYQVIDGVLVLMPGNWIGYFDERKCQNFGELLVRMGMIEEGKFRVEERKN